MSDKHPKTGHTPVDAGQCGAAHPETSMNRTEAKQPAMFELEKDLPLSQSLIWARQLEFYARRGLEAWTADNVPQFITNNPQIAEIYAQIVFEFLRDCMGHERAGRQLSPEHPLRIVELGAATGKFAYLFLRHLGPLLDRHGLAPRTVRYTMTDCSDAVVRSWPSNRFLAEFARTGVLDFAPFEAGQDASRLGSSGNSGAGPVVVIANYVFDSLPQDAFSFHDGQMDEFLVTTTAADQDENAAAELPLAKHRLAFQSVPIGDSRYSDSKWNRVLEEYRQRLTQATVLFPSGALSAISNLGRLSNGRMLVLAADKGDVYEDTLALAQGPPAFEWHTADCFSLITNFDAIGKAFRAEGGAALLPDKHASRLHICGFVKGDAGEHFPRTETAYRESQSRVGPDDVFALLSWLNSHMNEISVPQILSTLRLTCWDPIALLRLFPVLGRQLRSAGAEREDLRAAVLRTWANHYPVTPDENVLAFDCGVILLELRFFEEAMQMFRASEQALGPSASTSYNLGLCALGLERAEEALGFMKQACMLDPGFEPARRSREKLEVDNSGRR